MTALSVALQTDRRVAITLSGISAEVSPIVALTIYRDDLNLPRTAVRGFVDYVPTSDGVIAYDHEAPLQRPVYYVVLQTHEDGTVDEIIWGTVVLPATYPLVSDPVTGETAELTIETWTEIQRDGRATVVDVLDRPDPVVVSVGMAAASSAPVLRTDTLPGRLTLRKLLASAQVLQLRDVHPDVEDAYLAVGKHAEQRVTNNPLDLRRRHVLDVRHVSPPALTVAATGDTLEDFADAFPVDLQDIGDTYPPPWTLLDLVGQDLAAL